MADANTELDELSRLLRQANEQIRDYGKVTKETQDAIVDAQMKAKYGVEHFSKAANTAGQALGALAGAGIESTKAMYQGKKDATAFNASLGELAKAATLAGTALTLLMPGGFIMKGIVAAVTMLTGAVIATAQAANEMNAKLYKGFEGLAKSGAAASDGMSGVFRDAKKLGLSMDQLDSYVSLVAENSQELALLSGSVTGGRKKFADMSEALESSRVGFFALGISQQEQNETIMRYTKNMTLSGRAQTMTTKELADGARSYIMEQDRLTKLTGLNAQAQQQLLDRAKDSEQFNSKIRALEMENTVASRKAADGLREGLKIAAMGGEKTAAGFMAIATNNLRSADAQALFMSSYGTAMQAPLDIIAGMDPAKALQPMFDGIAQFERTTGNQISQLDASNGRFLASKEQERASIISSMGIEKYSAKVRADQATTMKLEGDAKTAEEARQIKERQDQNKKAETAIFKTIENAQVVNAKLLGTTNKLIDAFDKLTTAVTTVLNFFGLGPEVDKVDEKQTEITSAEKQLAMAKAAQTTAKTPEEKAAADREKLYYEERIKTLNQEKKTIQEQEENAALEKEVLRRAEHDAAVKKVAYDKSMETATTMQKLGFGLDKDQKKAKEDFEAADLKAGQLGIIGSTTRASAVQELKASGYKPLRKGKGGKDAKPEDVLEFSGASGGRENFDGLNADMKGALLSAGQQYFEQTNQKLKMNSGFRSSQDQQRLYNETVDAKRPGVGPNGYPVAQPGSSPHETGRAVDIQNFSDPKAVAALNSAGLFQNIMPTDPVHFQLQAADGGVFSGPDSGYPAALHGEEAVIPLNNGGGNFVKVFEDMAMMMGKQVGAMDELIRIAKNSNDIQTKILRVQQ